MLNLQDCNGERYRSYFQVRYLKWPQNHGLPQRQAQRRGAAPFRAGLLAGLAGAIGRHDPGTRLELHGRA